jgi:hypothetical protein
MANMSYCRFYNTSHALRDCLDALEDISSFTDIENEDEDRAVHRIAALAQLYLRRYEELQMEAEFEFARNMEDAE